MAIQKVLVMVGGQIQALQPGDTISVASSQYDSLSQTNGEASVAVVIGAPVYSFAAGSVKRAQANALSTARVVGLGLAASTAAAAAGFILTDGVLSASTAQWDAVAGTTGGLAFGAVYYLDAATPGKITATAPTTVGQVVTEIGTALSATDLNVNIKSPILL